MKGGISKPIVAGISLVVFILGVLVGAYGGNFNSQLGQSSLIQTSENSELIEISEEGYPFNEEAYLLAFPDVSEAIPSGFATALEHFKLHGDAEGRLSRDEYKKYFEELNYIFSEEAYLKAFPDVANAVKRGEEKSALDHWYRTGKKELRLSRPEYQSTLAELEQLRAGDLQFSEGVYLTLYPDVRSQVYDFDDNNAYNYVYSSAKEHYEEHGIREARLSNPAYTTLLDEVNRSKFEVLKSYHYAAKSSSFYYQRANRTRERLGVELTTLKIRNTQASTQSISELTTSIDFGSEPGMGSIGLGYLSDFTLVDGNLNIIARGIVNDDDQDHPFCDGRIGTLYFGPTLQETCSGDKVTFSDFELSLASGDTKEFMIFAFLGGSDSTHTIDISVDTISNSNDIYRFGSGVTKLTSGVNSKRYYGL